MPISEQITTVSTHPSASADDARKAARERLIVALDVPNGTAAIDLVNRLDGACKWFKVGLELFVAAGPGIVERLRARGCSIFLDLKFHDIPNTVAGAVRSAAGLGVQMMTVHATGGPEMLKAAKGALDGIADPPELLAVTVLTSMNASQLKSIGVENSPAEQVSRLAEVGLDAGFRGFVCSPQEVTTLRARTGPEGVLVVPGIRPAGAETGDQQRIATPAEALRQGASFLVVGRPITQAADPARAVDGILLEMGLL